MSFDVYICLWHIVLADRMNAIQRLRDTLIEQKADKDVGFFEVPLPNGTMARLPRMPMVSLCDD